MHQIASQAQTAPPFEEFWSFYVQAHRKFETQLFHVVGTLCGFAAGLACLIAGCFAWYGYLFFLPLTPALAYGPAWVSHFFIERNKPAAFSHPIFALLADLKMVAYFLAGKMPSEVRRYSA